MAFGLFQKFRKAGHFLRRAIPHAKRMIKTVAPHVQQVAQTVAPQIMDFAEEELKNRGHVNTSQNLRRGYDFLNDLRYD
jgi:hypothetical protein